MQLDEITWKRSKWSKKKKKKEVLGLNLVGLQYLFWRFREMRKIYQRRLRKHEQWGRMTSRGSNVLKARCRRCFRMQFVINHVSKYSWQFKGYKHRDLIFRLNNMAGQCELDKSLLHEDYLKYSLSLIYLIHEQPNVFQALRTVSIT